MVYYLRTKIRRQQASDGVLQGAVRRAATSAQSKMATTQPNVDDALER